VQAYLPDRCLRAKRHYEGSGENHLKANDPILHPIAEVPEPRDCSWCRQIDSKIEQLTNGGQKDSACFRMSSACRFLGIELCSKITMHAAWRFQTFKRHSRERVCRKSMQPLLRCIDACLRESVDLPCQLLTWNMDFMKVGCHIM